MKIQTWTILLCVAIVLAVRGNLSNKAVTYHDGASNPTRIGTATAASVSTGVRFSGDKGRVFKGAGPLAIDLGASRVNVGDKNKILFLSTSDPKYSDGGFGFGSGAAC